MFNIIKIHYMCDDFLNTISILYRGNNHILQQIRSFNNFLFFEMQNIINKSRGMIIISQKKYRKYQIYNNVEIDNFSIKLKRIFYTKPTFKELNNEKKKVLTPDISRFKNLNYFCNLFLDLTKEISQHQNTNAIKSESMEDFWIGKIPAMIQSHACNLHKLNREFLAIKGECPYDKGGYFIVNGNEKVLVAQEKLINNKVYVFKKNERNNIKLIAQCKSFNNYFYNQGHMVYLSLIDRYSNTKIKRWSSIYLKTALLRYEIPIMIVLRALGFKNDKDIALYSMLTLKNMKKNEILYESFVESSGVETEYLALEFIGARKFSRKHIKKHERILVANELLNKKFLPHMGLSIFSKLKKGFFLAYMINRLINVSLNSKLQDDKDTIGNKRIDSSGFLMAIMFNNLFLKFFKDTKYKIIKSIRQKKIISLDLAFDPFQINNGFLFALATGNWNIEGTLDEKTGVSQVLNRMSYLGNLSHLARLNASYTSSGKVLDVRRIHVSYWGFICPCETPEGQTCGIVKNFAFLSYVTNENKIKDSYLFLLIKYLLDFDKVNKNCYYNLSKVFLNGRLLGFSKNCYLIMKYFINIRRKDLVYFEISIVVNKNDNEIHLWSDSGRLKRPLFILKNTKYFFNFYHLKKINQIKNHVYKFEYILEKNIVEYLDHEEIQNCLIKLNNESNKKIFINHYNIFQKMYTHLEIHNSCILGVNAAQIPFSNHNQSPRNSYQSSMGKQAIGMSYLNNNVRWDTQNNLLVYFQRPLVFTLHKKLVNSFSFPSGLNTIVAIMSYTGFNQEDSLIMNQGSIERGLFKTIIFRVYSDKEDFSNPYMSNKFVKPKYTAKSMKSVNHFDWDGTRKLNNFIKGGDIIVGKISYISSKNSNISDKLETDSSLRLSLGNSGSVESVMVTYDDSGCKIIKTKVRTIRNPMIGDKFSSLHGQKGIVGMTFNESFMPFTNNSIIPDIIMNPHAIPSRMTIGHLIETVIAKVAATSCKFVDGTSIINKFQSSFLEHLNRFSFEHTGLEITNNGFNGNQLSNKIFIGPVYYQRLKHMVVDKYFSRARGPYETLTRQPVEGRSKEGGLRFGEMERDCVLSHGAAYFLKERLVDQSDVYRIHICEKSGLIGFSNLKNQLFWSKIWINSKICQIFIPYACKLLLQELMSMCITPRIVIKNKI
uniref:DNA-directed RNA polymerase subunit beta n=2 Tax=Lotharella oceanica TaxID=641309 RepID=A0A7S2TSD6_9EUKA|mmetsp:Transcript_27705/g.51656  ORF Transcript_27705/g.51656 Transcript_27705/m.51656 type:complete len:1165 (+) Transcript_27705:1287-4781(+)